MTDREKQEPTIKPQEAPEGSLRKEVSPGSAFPPPSSLGTISFEKHHYKFENGREAIYSWDKKKGKMKVEIEEAKVGRIKKDKKKRGKKILTGGKEVAKAVAEVIGTGVGAYNKARSS